MMWYAVIICTFYRNKNCEFFSIKQGQKGCLMNISMSEILIFIKQHFVLDLHWYKCFGVHNKMIAVRWLIQKYIWTWCSNDVSSCTSRSVECGGKCILKLTDYIAARKKFWLKSILHTFTYKQLIFPDNHDYASTFCHCFI